MKNKNNKPFEIMNKKNGEIIIVKFEGINGNWYINGWCQTYNHDVITYDQHNEWNFI